tara:strand:- start:3823 stop:5085 length:1263 start_codon:yes stop_codon:yes gene_type:complete
MAHNSNKKNIRKFLPDMFVEKTSQRQITIGNLPVSPIKSATGIISDGLHSDKKFILRDKFEFNIDKRENKRSEAGIIISRENIDNWKLELASARYIFDRDLSERFTATEFTELKKVKAPTYGTPIIDQFEYENVGYKEANSEKGGGWALAESLGENHILDTRANRTFVIVVNAYNYEDKKGRKNRDNLQYTWYFSAEPSRNFDTDVQNKVIGKSRKLLIDSVQRAHVGRYTCEISNDKGVSRTISQFLSVWRDGKIVELKGGDNNIPLGKFKWVDTYTRDKYNHKFGKVNSYQDYIVEEDKWVKMKYNFETKNYERTDIKKSMTRRPWNINRKIQWIKDNSMKGNIIESNMQRKQGYWKYNDNPTVYWSDSQGIYSFPNPSIYFDHRDQMGYERDWSDIKKFNRTQFNPYALFNDKIISY